LGLQVGYCGVKWIRVGNKRVGFYGEYFHQLDEKNRFFVPAKLREKLSFFGKKLILSRGLDRCLFLFPQSEWESLEEKASTLPLTTKEARQFTRHLFSGAMECELDGQGRISIPQNLKEYAGIEKEIVIIGVSNRIEIWASERWSQYFKEVDRNVEDIASRLDEFGI